MAPLKILLANQTFHPDVVATAQYLADFAEALAARGHHVTALAARRGYVPPHPVYPARETWRGVDILRVWPYSFRRSARWARVLDALCLNAAFALKLLSLRGFDRIVVLTSPPLVAVGAAAAARLHGSRLAYWTMDINPDEAVAAGWIRPGGPAEMALAAALRFVLRRSDRIVALDRFMKARLEAKGAPAGRIEVVPPWSGAEAAPAGVEGANPFRRAHGLEGRFVVMYSGNHSVCHPLDTLLEAARLLKEDPSVLFLFVGGGERVRDVLGFRERYGLANIRHLPYVPRDELRHSLTAADVHAVVMGEPFVGIVHPSKIYGIFGTGRPFLYIGPEESAIGEMIRKGAAGWRAAHGDAAACVSAILAAREAEPAARAAWREKNLAMAVRYSRTALCERLVRVVESC